MSIDNADATANFACLSGTLLAEDVAHVLRLCGHPPRRFGTPDEDFPGPYGAGAVLSDAAGGGVVVQWQACDRMALLEGHAARGRVECHGNSFLRQVLSDHAGTHGWSIEPDTDHGEQIRIRWALAR